MSLYPVVSSLAILEPGEGGGGSAEGSFVVAVRACGLVSPAGRPLRPGERSMLVVGGTEKIRGGELAVFCKGGGGRLGGGPPRRPGPGGRKPCTMPGSACWRSVWI